MTYSWINFIQIPILPKSVDLAKLGVASDMALSRRLGQSEYAYKYRLLRFTDGERVDRPLYPDSKRNVVLMVPGSAASFSQVRSLGTQVLHTDLTKSKTKSTLKSNVKSSGGKSMGSEDELDIYVLDFKEEMSALSGALILDQTNFMADAIETLVNLYSPSVKVIVVGSSMGGVVARLAASRDNIAPSIRAIFTLSTPHMQAVLRHDVTMSVVYYLLQSQHRKLPLISVAGGYRDNVVPSPLATLDGAEADSLSLLVAEMNGTQLSVDHRAMLWCNAPITLIATACHVAAKHSHWASIGLVDAIAKVLLRPGHPRLNTDALGDLAQEPLVSPIAQGYSDANFERFAPSVPLLAWAVQQARCFGAERFLASLAAAALMTLRCMCENTQITGRSFEGPKEVPNPMSFLNHVRTACADLRRPAITAWVFVLVMLLPRDYVRQYESNAFVGLFIQAFAPSSTLSPPAVTRMWFYLVGLSFVAGFDMAIRLATPLLERVKRLLGKAPVSWFVKGIYYIPTGWALAKGSEKLPRLGENESVFGAKFLRVLVHSGSQVCCLAGFLFIATWFALVELQLLFACSSKPVATYAGRVRGEDHLRIVGLFYLATSVLFLGGVEYVLAGLMNDNSLEDMLLTETVTSKRSVVYPAANGDDLTKFVQMQEYLRKDRLHLSSVWPDGMMNLLEVPGGFVLFTMLYIRYFIHVTKTVVPCKVFTSTPGKWTVVREDGKFMRLH